MPTDTFCGLAVDPVNLRAVESIYEIKSRLKHKPLSLLIAEVEQAYELARDLDGSFDVLAERFWPGPLTLIVRAGAKLPLRSTANTGNVALRVPDAAIPRAVVAALGLPITATSANLHGAPECTHAEGVRDQIGERIPLIVDGGPTVRRGTKAVRGLAAGAGQRCGWAGKRGSMRAGGGSLRKGTRRRRAAEGCAGLRVGCCCWQQRA